MSKFFVGCRIKVREGAAVNNAWLAHLVGAELVIASSGPDNGVDSWFLNATSMRGLKVGAFKHTADKYWIPIQPSGAAPSEHSYTELMDRLKAGEVECV